MKINELFDRVADWKWTALRGKDIAQTKVNGKEVTLTIYKQDIENGIYIEFDVDGHMKVTNKGNAVHILGIVTKAIVDYVNTHNPEFINFTAENDENSRVKLYTAMCNRLKTQLPYRLQVQQDDPDDPERVEFWFTKKKPKTVRPVVPTSVVSNPQEPNEN